MKLSKSEVEHIAMLARLRLTDEEKGKFGKQLSSILDYVNKLQAVDAKGVAVTAQITGLENVYRDDEVKEGGSATRGSLLKNAPEVEDGLVKTKSVFG